MTPLLLSIIIPAYNVEKTLSACLDSIIMQTLNEWEIIIIDDGAKDRSGEIADEYAEKDSRIRVLHTNNYGLSMARNKGIEEAKGKYITFIDSDDTIEKGTLTKETLAKMTDNDIDILEYPYRLIKKESTFYDTFNERIFDTARDYWLITKAWNHTYAWNKIYKRSIFSNLRFTPNTYYEDLYLYPHLLLTNPKVMTTDKGMYNYLYNDAGITSQAKVSADNIKILLDAERQAAQLMKTTILSKNGYNLYLAMIYRQVDIYRLSGEIILKWPFIRLICWMHKKLRHS